MRKIPAFALLALASLTIISMQNCGSFKPNDVIVGNGEADPNTPQTERGEELQCNLAGKLQKGTPLTIDQQVAAYGRISHSYMGFLTKDGRAFFESRTGTLTELDAGTKYAWMDFDMAESCGITTTGQVRCQEFDKTTWVNVSGLAGSIQVNKNGDDLCGLDAAGVLTCLKNGVPTKIATPEPLVLITDNEVYTRNTLRRYSTGSLVRGAVVEWNVYQPIIGFMTKVQSFSQYGLDFCDLEIASASFADTDNYQSDRGCAVTRAGDLVCLETRIGAQNEKELVTLNPTGEFTRELVSLDPGKRYVVVQRDRGGRLACAIRENNDAVCFNTGFLTPGIEIEQMFGLTAVKKDLFRISSPETVSQADANSSKSCVLKGNSATCWRTPSVDVDGTVHMPYQVESTSLVSLAGFINTWEGEQVFARACFLNQDRHLVCETNKLSESESGKLLEQDPGVVWKEFAFETSQPSKSCGITSTGDVRCTKEYSGSGKDIKFESIAKDAVAVFQQEFLFRDGTYEYAASLTSNLPPKNAGAIFKEDIPGHPGLFIGTNGKRYVMTSSGAAEVPGATFSKVNSVRNVAPGVYHNAAANLCPYFSSGFLIERVCTQRAPANIDATATYAFVSIRNGVFIQTNGKVSSTYGGNSELHFLPPAVMTPVN